MVVHVTIFVKYTYVRFYSILVINVPQTVLILPAKEITGCNQYMIKNYYPRWYLVISVLLLLLLLYFCFTSLNGLLP
jgi:hypothetical protein